MYLRIALQVGRATSQFPGELHTRSVSLGVLISYPLSQLYVHVHGDATFTGLPKVEQPPQSYEPCNIPTAHAERVHDGCESSQSPEQYLSVSLGVLISYPVLQLYVQVQPGSTHLTINTFTEQPQLYEP